VQHSPEQWIAKAESDLTAARDLMRIESESLDAICFHCQQSGEKYLKALMAANGLSIPRTHILPRLLQLLAAAMPSNDEVKRECAWLSMFAVDTRYPAGAGLAVTPNDARRALAVAARIKQLCEPRLNSTNTDH